jgi:hypothetical protein
MVLFILCHSLRWIPNLWELQEAGRKKVSLLPIIRKPLSLFTGYGLIDRYCRLAVLHCI